MKAICLLDSSVLCELINVPGKAQNASAFRSDYDQKVADGEAMFLPLAALIETGNHVGKVSDQAMRADVARRFVKVVKQAVEAAQPFQLLRCPDRGDVAKWLDALPDWVTKRPSGLGDLSIRTEWQRLRAANRQRRVYVWSKDEDLSYLDSHSS